MTLPSVSLITYSKGRLHHLQHSLSHLLRQDYPGEWEVLVVDYDCPDGTLGFVQGVGMREPRLKGLALSQHESQFNVSRARNLGANHAQGEILALIDVDHLPVTNYLTRGVRAMLEAGLQRCNPGDAAGVFGDCFVTQQLFQRVRGYDEAFIGWGWDDIDFYTRTEALGERTTLIPRSLVGLIHHENDDRVRFSSIKDPNTSAWENYRISCQPGRRVNLGGFGVCSDPVLYRASPLRGWDLLQSRYPWPRHRPLLPVDDHGWLGAGNVRLLTEWLSNHAPRLILELGSWLGRSTRFFLQTCAEARVIAVDHWGLLPSGDYFGIEPERVLRLYPQFQANCWSEKDRLGLCRNDTINGLREIAGLGLSPDFIYLDADHSRSAVERDLQLLSELFPQAVWAGDDWNWHDAEGPTIQPLVRQLAEQTQRTLRVDGEGWLLHP